MINAEQSIADQPHKLPVKMEIRMTTNVTPKEKVRTILIYPEIPFNKYIELY